MWSISIWYRLCTWVHVWDQHTCIHMCVWYCIMWMIQCVGKRCIWCKGCGVVPAFVCGKQHVAAPNRTFWGKKPRHVLSSPQHTHTTTSHNVWWWDACSGDDRSQFMVTKQARTWGCIYKYILVWNIMVCVVFYTLKWGRRNESMTGYEIIKQWNE